MSESTFTYNQFTLPINTVSINSINGNWQFFNSVDPNTAVKEESGTYDMILQPVNNFIEIPNSPSRVKSFYNYYGVLSLKKSDNSSTILIPCNRILVLNIVERDIELTIIPHYVSKVTGIAEDIQYTFSKLKLSAGVNDLTPLILELFKILFIENKYLKPRCPVCQSLGTIYQDSPKEGILKSEDIICPDCTIGSVNLYFHIIQQMDFDKSPAELIVLINNLMAFLDNGINLVSNLKDNPLLNEFYILKSIILTKNTENRNAAKEAEEIIEKVIEYSKSTNNNTLFEKSLPILSLLNQEKANSLVAQQISKGAAEIAPLAPKPSAVDTTKDDILTESKPDAPDTPKPVSVPPPAPKPSAVDTTKDEIPSVPIDPNTPKPIAPIAPKPVSVPPPAPKPSAVDTTNDEIPSVPIAPSAPKPIAPIAPKPVSVPPPAPKPSAVDTTNDEIPSVPIAPSAPKPIAPIAPKPVSVPPPAPKPSAVDTTNDEIPSVPIAPSVQKISALPTPTPKDASTSDDLDLQIPVAPKKPTKNKLLEFSGLKLESAIADAQKEEPINNEEVPKTKDEPQTSKETTENKEEKPTKKKIIASFDTSEILGQFEKLEEEKKENEKLYKQSHLELSKTDEKTDAALTFIPPDQIPLEDLEDFDLDSSESEEEIENESSLPEIEEIKKIPLDNKEALVAKGFSLIESAQKAFEQERYKDTITLVQEGGRILIEHEQWGEEDIQRMMDFINIVKEKLDVQEQENKLKAAIPIGQGSQSSSEKQEVSQDPKSKFLFKPKQASPDFFSTIVTKKEEKKKDAGLFASTPSKKGGSDSFSFTPKEGKKKEEKKKGKK